MVIYTQRTFVRSSPGTGSERLLLRKEGDSALPTDTAPVWADGLQWWLLTQVEGVDGWSARKALNGVELFTVEREMFETAIEFTLDWEDGYVDHPEDKGGPTKFGISQTAYPHLDIKNLTKEQAIEIYYEDYWLKSRAYLYPLPKCLILLDIAVLTGVSRALSLRTLKSPAILATQLDFFAALAKFTTFGRGWIRRTADLVGLLDLD